MPKVKKQKCAGCGEVIKDGVVMAMGKCWHKGHFVCAHCKKQLKGIQFVQEDNQPYCEQDWAILFGDKDLPKCADCNIPIRDTPITALGQHWHKEHFVCAHCKKPFMGKQFFTEDGRAYCETDHKSLFGGQQAPSKNLQEQAPPGTSNILQDKAHIPICESCREPITGTVTYALNKSWHKEHFSCAHCKKPFMDTKFITQDGRPYCETDHKSLFGGQQAPSTSKNLEGQGQTFHIPICESCKVPISGTVTFALGKSWHKEHFVCAHCKKPFNNSGFGIMNGNAYCNKDYATLFGKKCSACNQSIQDVVLTALNKHWHKTCFTCNKCKTPISAQQQFIEKNGVPICSKCV